MQANGGSPADVVRAASSAAVKFEQAEKQLQLVGEELTRLRDATSAAHAAHVLPEEIFRCAGRKDYAEDRGRHHRNNITFVSRASFELRQAKESARLFCTSYVNQPISYMGGPFSTNFLCNTEKG